MNQNRQLRIKLMFDAAAKSYKAGTMSYDEYNAEVTHLTALKAELDAE